MSDVAPAAPSAAQQQLIDQFLDSLWLEKGLSQHPRNAYRTDLRSLAGWLEGRGGGLQRASRADLMAYLGWRLAAGYQARSSARMLSCVRSFYRYLLRQQLISEDPTRDVAMPKLGRPLPKSLSEADVERLLAAPDTEDSLGLRDRCMLEVLYATGLRVSELVGLRLDQLNLRQGVVRVTGKGSKERLVPLGEEAMSWLEQYLHSARIQLLAGKPSDVLFPSRLGQMMTRQTFWHRIKQHALTAGIRSNLEDN